MSEQKRTTPIPAPRVATDIDDVVKHTDSGSGKSQEKSWRPDSDSRRPSLSKPAPGAG
jgi:hypothetical protein